MILGQAHDLARSAALVQGEGVDVEAAVVDRRHEHQPPAVGGETWLDIDRAVACQGPGPSAGGVQEPELDGVVPVGGEGDEPAVG